jgi:hypothetical protein
MPPMAQPQDIKFEENGRNRHFCLAKAAHTIEDVKHPGYFWRGAHKFRRWDRIEIVHEGGDYLAEILIVDVDHDAQGIHGRVLTEQLLTTCEAIVPNMDGAFVAEAGGGWAVRVGQVVLKDGFKSEQQAGKWLLDKTQSLNEQKGS